MNPIVINEALSIKCQEVLPLVKCRAEAETIVSLAIIIRRLSSFTRALQALHRHQQVAS